MVVVIANYCKDTSELYFVTSHFMYDGRCCRRLYYWSLLVRNCFSPESQKGLLLLMLHAQR